MVELDPASTAFSTLQYGSDFGLRRGRRQGTLRSRPLALRQRRAFGRNERLHRVRPKRLERAVDFDECMMFDREVHRLQRGVRRTLQQFLNAVDHVFAGGPCVSIGEMPVGHCLCRSDKAALIVIWDAQSAADTVGFRPWEECQEPIRIVFQLLRDLSPVDVGKVSGDAIWNAVAVEPLVGLGVSRQLFPSVDEHPSHFAPDDA